MLLKSLCSLLCASCRKNSNQCHSEAIDDLSALTETTALSLRGMPVSERSLFDSSVDGLPTSWFFARLPTMKHFPRDVMMTIADMLFKDQNILVKMIERISSCFPPYPKDVCKQRFSEDLQNITELPDYMLPDPIRDSTTMTLRYLPSRMKPAGFLYAGKIRRYSSNSTLFIALGEVSKDCFELSSELKPTTSSEFFAMMLIYFQHLTGAYELDVRISVSGKPPNDQCEIYVCMPMPESEMLVDPHMACFLKISTGAAYAFIDMLLIRLCTRYH
jgi:hypothetical protein